MAEREALRVVLDEEAKQDLKAIWRWNANQYDEVHANDYIEFLVDAVQKLGGQQTLAKPVVHRPHFKYVTIRRSRRGHGHIAVFSVKSTEVHVLRFFHTAEDWERKL